MARKLTQEQRTILERDRILAAARGMPEVTRAVITLDRSAEAITMQLAEPGERLHGRRYQNRVKAVRELIVSGLG